MNKSISSRPVIKAGWLRALLYIVALGLGAGITIGFYIATLPMSHLTTQILQSINPGVITLLLFVPALLITFIFRRWIDRKSFISLGLHLEGHVQEAMAGALFAILIMGASSLLLKATGHLKWMDIIFDPRALFLTFGSILLIAFYEELIFRGYILNNLMDSFPKWLALLISALLFMIFHWNSAGFFPVLTTLIMGLIIGLNYLYTRNLWFSICFHTAWKYFEAPLLGFSGNESSQTLLQIDLHGDENITGGVNGLEGSVFLMAVSLLSLLTLYLLLQKKLNPRSQPVPGRI